MNFKPSDFFIGVLDFLAILLPGGLLAFLAQDYAKRYIFNQIVLPALEDNLHRWIAFIFASYVLGHIVSTVGGPLDELSDRILNPRFSVFWRSKGESKDKWWKKIIPVTLKKKASTFTPLEQCASEYAQRYLRTYNNINQLKVITSYVQLGNPVAATEIERLKATSRFFRSLTIILLLIILMLIYKSIVIDSQIWGTTVACFLIWTFSFWLYAYQRWKRKESIFSYFIAMNLDKLPVKEIRIIEESTGRCT